MALQTRVASILMKVESSEGVDSSPAAANGLFAMISPPVAQPTFAPAQTHTGKGAPLPGVMGAMYWKLPIKCLLRGAGAAYSASVLPKADALLRAFGFSAAGTFTAQQEKWEYTFRSSAFESFSTYVYFAGRVYKLLGARGRGTIRFPLGGIPILEGELSAKWTRPIDGALVAPTGEPSIAFPAFLTSTFQIGTENYAAKHGEVSLDCGRELAMREDASAAQGYDGAELLGDYRPFLNFDAQDTIEATFPWFTKLDTGAQMDCTFSVGATQYNRIKASAPVMQFEGLEQTDKSGVVYNRAKCGLSDPAGGDAAFTLTFD